MRTAAGNAQERSEDKRMSTPDLAITCMTIVTVTVIAACLLGLRTVARQLRIAAPPKEAPAGVGSVPPGGTP